MKEATAPSSPSPRKKAYPSTSLMKRLLMPKKRSASYYGSRARSKYGRGRKRLLNPQQVKIHIGRIPWNASYAYLKEMCTTLGKIEFGSEQ